METGMPEKLKAFCVPAFFLYPFLVAGALFFDLPVKFLPLILVFAAGVSAVGSGFRWLWLIGAASAVALFFTEESVFLKLYPVLMNAAVAGIFAASLAGTPLIAVFAKKMGYELNDAAERNYARKATLAWAVFMTANALVSLATVFLPLSVWTVYNGGISYVLIGLMMCGEYVVRRKVQGRCAAR